MAKRMIASQFEKVIQMVVEFSCNSKRLADYLVMNGSNLIRIDKENKSVEYIFEYDDSIDDVLKNYEEDFKRCMF